MVINDAKMVANIIRLATLVTKNDANLALPPRFRQVLIELPLKRNLHFAQERQVSRMDTNAELADMHLAYGAANCSGPAAQRLYAERYPMRRIPSHNFFARLHQRLAETG
ncbi:DUF4817 domain-containing protein [Trichonephila clavipes]|uniref:DUF4817 domain-containing protein n=1 Tax=Trichonephila clavipes TaxID=2585209 RepID=A0A8X7B7F6_TRICX|nr:DUF4817 domain-containing protein [Trichonephila clavipes]